MEGEINAVWIAIPVCGSILFCFKVNVKFGFWHWRNYGHLPYRLSFCGSKPHLHCKNQRFEKTCVVVLIFKIIFPYYLFFFYQNLSYLCWYRQQYLFKKTVNTLTARQYGSGFADDIFKWIFVNENVQVSIKIALKFVQFTIFHHWFKWLLGAEQAISHYLNQWCSRLPTHICITYV